MIDLFPDLVATDTITDPRKRMWTPIGEPFFFHNSFEWSMFLNPGKGNATDTAIFSNTVAFSEDVKDTIPKALENY